MMFLARMKVPLRFQFGFLMEKRAQKSWHILSKTDSQEGQIGTQNCEKGEMKANKIRNNTEKKKLNKKNRNENTTGRTKLNVIQKHEIFYKIKLGLIEEVLTAMPRISGSFWIIQ